MKAPPANTAKDWLFVDAGKKVPLARAWFDDAEPTAAAEVVRSGWLCQGPKVAQFEEQFAFTMGAKHAIAVSNGSIALLVALQALGVEPGDEVIAPSMTFISSATAGMVLGARPVLCDINLTNYCIDVERLESLITKRTKVIVPVHYAGQTADMDRIQELADRHGLSILEDAAEAHLARYRGGKFAGTLGNIGIFSFTPTKPMTTGEGGMIVTDDDHLAAQCRLIRNFGDSGKFQWDILGFNYRLNEVAAAIGICQLKKLDQIIAMRREKAKRYDDAFADEAAIIIPWARSVEDINYQLYTIRFQLDLLDASRDQLMDELAELGVATRLYYPSLHRQKVFAPFGPHADRDFSNSIAFEQSALSLPIFTGLTFDEQDYVSASLLNVVRRHRKGAGR
ncbi:MAG TPA: DegT/DnrJ/EryC1/StrS family aminotransferase [Pirellulales bacterium]|jgi:dTDP-4-amino-4,6-dideoxygalactose transaminase